MTSLNNWGWTKDREKQTQKARTSYDIGRIILGYNQWYTIITDTGECNAQVSGKLKHDAKTNDQMPAVGDWVLIEKSQKQTPLIHSILPRHTIIARKEAGKRPKIQVIATNIDTLFIVHPLTDTYNPRSIERYLVTAFASGATPVILLTKADIGTKTTEKINQTQDLAPHTPIHSICTLSETILDTLSPYLIPGKTLACIGPSGAGKSSLINTLSASCRQKTQTVRNNDKGMHTTRHRELIQLPNGTLIIDTPGMREIEPWDIENGIHQTFPEITNAAQHCQFRNCTHRHEPGCHVQEEVSNQRILTDRLNSYLKLKNL